MNGYILISRSIVESRIWDKPPLYLKLWIWILSNAQYQTYKGMSRGQLWTTYNEMIEAMSWHVGFRKVSPSRSDIYKILEFMRSHESDNESDNESDTKDTMIETMKATRGILITICNFNDYQDPKFYERDNEGDDERTTKDTMKELRKVTGQMKHKKQKNTNNNNTYIAPTLDDVIQYASMNGFKSDPRKFFDYYSSRDWKTKNGTPIDNWETCFDAWERRDKSEIRNADIHSPSISEEVARGTRPDYRIKPTRPL